VDSADVDEHALPRGGTATGDKSPAKISRNLKTKTRKAITDVSVCRVIRVHDAASNVIETYEYKADFKD